MLWSLDSLLGFALHEQDGDLGKVHDFYFDDDTWTVRYLVVETGRWFQRKRVLVAASIVTQSGWEHRKFCVPLTKEQVLRSPKIDTDAPVSRQHEIEMQSYYGWPAYWTMEPYVLTPPPQAVTSTIDRTAQGDPHLRSFRELTTYRAWTTDGFAGFVEDFFVDDANWEIRCLRVALGEWWPHKMVGLERKQVSEISWREKLVRFSLNRKQIEEAPPPVSAARPASK
ncbi:MAG: PRC-barrel domain-containing protein [Acidobacteriota bacterium]